MPSARIVVDLFERESGIPDELRRLGTNVEIRPLRVGDYALGQVLVERKRIDDLHGSIVKGRFWRQLGRLRRATRFPYLLVEGQDLDRGPLSARSIRGACLAVSALGVALLRSSDQRDSAVWLQVLALRVARNTFTPDRPPYAQRPRSPREAPGEAMLAAVPGISVGRARELLARFGSVAAVVAADEEAWQSIPGIGPKRAAAIARAVGRPEQAH